MHLSFNTEFRIASEVPGCARRALQDLQRDLRVTCRRPATNSVAVLELAPALGEEAFAYGVQAGRLVIRGGDARGLIYGLYAVSRDCLGIPPLWYWVDFAPEVRDWVEIPEGTSRQSAPPVVRCRGWFINGEDLLFGWAPDPKGLFDHEAYERIFEALLRARGNMIIPGTNLFPDEACWQWAAARGLMLAEHHHEPLGLNSFRWPEHVPYDYLADPQRFEAIWERTVPAKLAHGARVVWSLGLRGRKDTPLWSEIPAIAGDPRRQGEVLSEIVSRQLAIIRRHDPDPLCVYNLWMEGADVFHHGHLRIPDEVVTVWPDNGHGVLTDRGRLAAGQGIYVHPGMCGSVCSHITEWMPLARLETAFRRCEEAGATAYALLNVESIRPYGASVSIAMDWLDRGVADASAERFFREVVGLSHPAGGVDWHGDFTAATRALAADEDHLFGDQGFTYVTCRTVDALLRPEQNPAKRFLPALPGAGDDRLGAWVERAEAAAANFADALALCLDLGEMVPARNRGPFETLMRFQSEFRVYTARMMLAALRAKQAADAGDVERVVPLVDEALRYADVSVEHLKRAASGKWQGFYVADVFNATRLPARKLRLALEVLQGLMPLPTGYTDGASGTQWYWLVSSHHQNRTVDAD